MPAQEIETLRARLEPFLRQLLERADFDLQFRIRPGPPPSDDPALAAPDVVVHFSGPDSDLLLQRAGELLDALEDVTLRFLRLRPEERATVGFDCQDYKALRVEELRLTAQTAAERVARSGMPFALNPMNSRDRRLIHLFLKENAAVRTESEGFGTHRQVVIFPAGKQS